MTVDEQAALAVHEGWVRANRTGDVGWLRENLDADYWMANTNGSVYRGVDQICELWEYYRTQYAGWGTVPGPEVTCESAESNVWVVGDTAWVAYHGRFAGVSTGGEGKGDFGQ